MTNSIDQNRIYDFVISEWFTSDAVRRNGSFSQLDEADSSYSGSLVYCQNHYYLELAGKNPNVSAIITTPAMAAEPILESKALVTADNPRLTFFELYSELYAKGLNRPTMEFSVGKDSKIHPSAIVSSKVKIGDRVEIGPGAVIEDFVQIMDDVTVGSNAVVGAEGLITLRRQNGSLLTIKHAGSVSVGNGVVILAGAVVAKSLFRKPTAIGAHSQIGIMSTVGHGVTIGEQSVISGNSVIAGRTKLGRGVWMGASSSIAQGLAIGDEAQIKMGSIVVSNVAPRAIVSGNFAVSHKVNMRHFLRLKRDEKI